MDARRPENFRKELAQVKIRPSEFFDFGHRPTRCPKCGEEASHSDYTVSFFDNTHGGLLLVMHVVCGWIFGTMTHEQSLQRLRDELG